MAPRANSIVFNAHNYSLLQNMNKLPKENFERPKPKHEQTTLNGLMFEHLMTDDTT